MVPEDRRVRAAGGLAATSAHLAPTWRAVARAELGEGAGEALLAPCPWSRRRRTM